MVNIKKIKEMLTTAIFEVFEKMFYVFSEPLQSNSDGYQMKASINFSGPVNGEIQIFLNRTIAETMVKNMLGFDQGEINEPIMADCVKESLNMICGNFVRKLDPERVFHLSIPTFEMISEKTHYGQEGQEQKEQEVRLTFASDNGNIEVIMIAPGVI
jgi:CheY-specific phosphatase CheX